MAIITLEETEYETDDMSKEAQDVVKIVETNQQASTILNHTLQCVNAIGSMKIKELKTLLGDTKDGKEL